MNPPLDADPVLIACGGREADAARVAREAIGFKAHNLVRMVALGLPVPPAFVLGTGWCARADALRRDDWQPALRALEQATGSRLGDARRPLIVSVRSGAPVSMPGMMDTLLDIGLADATLPGLLRATGQPRLVWDAYRRLVAGYGELVLGVPAQAFEADLEHIAAGRDPRELDFAELRAPGQLRTRGRACLPAGSAAAARGGDPLRVRELERRACARLPAAARAARHDRHRRAGATHGVRQRRRHLGRRRRLHAPPVDR
jgi:hypothetical protein